MAKTNLDASKTVMFYTECSVKNICYIIVQHPVKGRMKIRVNRLMNVMK